MTTARLSRPVIAALHASKIIGIRAGSAPHRFIGVWIVVVKDRAFIRPWNDKPTGWYRVFRADPSGVLQVGDREIKVRAKPAPGDRLRDAIDAAYAAKYPTPGSRGYVRGFALPRRRKTTTELVPR